MCGRFTRNASPGILAETFDLPELLQIDPQYNIAPGDNTIEKLH
jgi:putative SOS response-associated peptidase YedK